MPRLLVRRIPLLLVLTAIGAGVELPPPASDAWQPLVFRRVERQTVYTAVEDGGRPALRAEADCSASARVLRLDALRLDETPVLRWRWKVDRALSHEDERSREGDDFAARVYVMFAFEPERASLWERARRRLAESIYDAPMPGAAINYVWTAHEPEGGSWENPYVESSIMVSMGPGPAGTWRTQTADVAADYRRLFGREPSPLLGVALMSDADDTCERAVAWFADLRFSSR